MPVHVLTEAANKAIDAYDAYLKAHIGKVVIGKGGLSYILTPATAMRLRSDNLRRIVNDGGYVEAHDGREISVKCSECGARQTVYAKVTRYRCRCNPHRERATFQDIQTGPT